MKKLAIFLAIMLIPFSAFALDTISDNDLDDVTGQAGVSIYTNSIQIVKTGVTTTYTDDDDLYSSNVVNIVSNNATTQIFFEGVDPLMIDIIDMKTLSAQLAGKGLIADSRDYGDTGIMITLPDGIKIVNAGSASKTYYAGSVDDSNKIISAAVTGGTTTISQADPGWAVAAALTTAYAHDDQVKIIITAHEDY